MDALINPNYSFGVPAGVTFTALLLAYLVVGLPVTFWLLYCAYHFLTLPMRRNERASLLLDLLELGLEDGRTPEAALIDAAKGGREVFGERYDVLTAHLTAGIRLGPTLELLPHFTPLQVGAMIRAGERIGDVRKVLPACRQLLRDGVSQVRGANNYLVLLAFCITPLTLLVPLFIGMKVLPAFQTIFASYGTALPAFSVLVFDRGSWFMLLELAFMIGLWALTFAYIGGPRLRTWLGRLFPGVPDALTMLLPWKRKRLQRDFSTMLAVLLDANVPEPEAVGMAAETTVNRLMIRRAEKVKAQLASGMKLTEALRVMDEAGELRWRLTNALQGRGGFLRALSGWHEALDARAFQMEQASAQVATSALVLINGAMVACVVIAVFLLLIHLINEASLW